MTSSSISPRKSFDHTLFAEIAETISSIGVIDEMTLDELIDLTNHITTNYPNQPLSLELLETAIDDLMR